VGVGRIFSMGEIVDFFKGSRKGFPGCANFDEILIYPLKTKRTTFLAKHLIGIYKISKSRGEPRPKISNHESSGPRFALHPSSDAHGYPQTVVHVPGCAEFLFWHILVQG